MEGSVDVEHYEQKHSELSFLKHSSNILKGLI